MQKVLAVLALLLVASAAIAEAHPAKGFANNLYDCVVKAKLTNLQMAIQAAGLRKMLSNSSLAVTLFAPDQNSFAELLDDLEYDMNKLVKRKPFLQRILSYHVVPGIHKTSSWPKYKDPSGSKLVDTLLINEGKPMQLELYTDADGHPQAAGNDNDVELNCASVINLVCGKSIMHSIDEVLIPVTEPIEDKK